MPKEQIFTNLQSFNLQLELEQYEKLRAAAKKRKQSMSAMLRELITKHIK